MSWVRKFIMISKIVKTEKGIRSAQTIRMRGIPTPCIKYKAKQEQIGVMGMYEQKV